MFAECKWEKEDYQTFHNHLFSLQDEKYRDFQQRLLPGLEDSMIGVRITILRKLAKDILKGNPLSFLADPPSDYFEDIMVQGMVVAGLREDYSLVLTYIRGFVPKINNWAVCDCFVASLRLVKAHKKEFYAFLNEYLHSQEEFHLRFAIVSIMSNYIEPEYIDDVLKNLDAVDHPGYYVKMAVAWAISVAYVKEREKTLKYLQACSLDDWTYNKALQKIVESNRVTDEEKAQIKTMKRKVKKK